MLEGVNSEDGEPNLGEAANRALHTARFYRAGRVRWILISAGNLPWLEAREPEARSIASLLKEWGCLRMPCSSRQRAGTLSKMPA